MTRTKRFPARISFAFALAAAALLAPIAARAACFQASRSGSSSFSFGNSMAGVDGRFSASARVSSPDCAGTPYAVARAAGNSDLRMFGLRYSLLDAEAEASNTSSGSNVILHLEIGPITLIDVDNPHHRTWSRSYPITLVRASRTFTVGPVPVQLTVSVGAGISGSLTLQPAYPVQLSGNLQVWARGTAGAYLNAAILRAGVRSTLDLLRTTLASNLRLAQNGVSGRVTLSFVAVRIRIRLVVDRRSCSVSWRGIKCRWKEIAGYTVVDYSRGSYTRTLFTF